jgi:hypothetical protein
MPRKKKLHVGDLVYALDSRGHVIEALIKTINEEEMCPYELNIDSKLRFFTRNDLFLTRQDAEVALVKAEGARVKRQLENGAACDADVPCCYDPKTHTFLDDTGNRISEYYEASPEVVEQYSNLVSQLCALCHKESLPFFAIACMKRNKKNKFAFLTSSIYPGPRVPDLMYTIEDLLNDEGPDDGPDSSPF